MASPSAPPGLGHNGGPSMEYDLGDTACSVYAQLQVNRDQVLEMARNMAELTVYAVMPRQGYVTGDDVAGNNQSIGAHALNNLASKLMFMAFPPGQPMMRFEPVEEALQQDISQNPDLWAKTQMGLSRLEIAHRNRANTINLATAWNGFMKLMLVAGNALWKHVQFKDPTYWKPDCYVVQRSSAGHPLLTIHKERVRVSTLPKDHREIILKDDHEDLDDTPEWKREADVYSVCRLKDGDGDEMTRSWEYWQETDKGEMLPGTEVTTDYDAPPMWPGWLIPVYGQNWGRGYCEEYRGDLFALETAASALTDGASLAALALLFVNPGGQASIQQVRKAENLSILPGKASDLSVFRSEKTGDLQFVMQYLEAAARRIGAAFLLQSAVQRSGERVTAEEVSRVGQELDQAMGGLYTQIAQGNQRVMVQRFIVLHEEANKLLPKVPPGVIEVQVVTGVDAMGRSLDAQNLVEGAKTIQELFPQQGSTILIPTTFAKLLFAAKGIKTDGLVNDPNAIAADQAQQKKDILQKALVERGTAPLAKGFADAVGSHVSAAIPPPPGGGVPPPSPTPAPGAPAPAGPPQQ